MLNKTKKIYLISFLILALSVTGFSRNIFKKIKKGIKNRNASQFKLKNMNRKSIYVKIYYYDRNKNRKRSHFRLRRGQTRSFWVRENTVVKLRYGYAGKKKKYRRIRIGKRGKLITLRALRYRRAGSRSRVGYIKLRNRTGKSVFVKITYYNRFNRRKVRTYYLSNGRNKAIAAKRGSRFRIRYGTKRYGNKKRRRGKITGKYRYIYLR